MGRRELLGLVGGGAFAALAGSPVLAAQDASDNLRLVKDFCAAWSTLDPVKVAAYFADSAVYRVTETAPRTVGLAAIRPLLQRFLQRAQAVRFEIVRAYSVGPIVLTERHDHFKGPQGERVFHVAGVFFVRNGKIAEWTDYMIRP